MKKSICMLAMLPLALAFMGCDDGLSGSKGNQADYDWLCLTWGWPLVSVEYEMRDYTLLAEEDDMLVYKDDLNGYIISYGFESQELISTSVFIKADSVAVVDLVDSFSSYELLSGYDELTYVNVATNTVGEIATVEVSDGTYYCLSWSYLDEL